MFDVWSDAKMEKRIKELESENEKLKNILRKAFPAVLEYYMTAEELELWNNYEKNNSHQS